MNVSRVARRYAKAIYDDIPADPGVASFMEDLAGLAELLAASRDLRMFFTSPIIAEGVKVSTVRALCVERFGATIERMLVFLIEKGRESQIAEVVEALFELHRKRNGVHFAAVTSAAELASDQRTKLESALSAASGGSVETTYATDPALIGGVVARIGDIVYDGSIARQLNRLRTRFAAGM